MADWVREDCTGSSAPGIQPPFRRHLVELVELAFSKGTVKIPASAAPHRVAL
jgi:hypothetical protein